MTTTNSHLTKRVDYACIKHLMSRAEGNDKAKSLLAELIKELRLEDNKMKYSSEAELRDIYACGLTLLDAPSSLPFVENESNYDQSPKFARYVEKVTSKGVFAGLLPETPAYAEKMEKVKKAYVDKFVPKIENAEQAEKDAEVKKLEGNDKLSAGDYNAAISCYSRCLELSPAGPNSHIYFSNRAAAYTHLKDFEKAADDCLAAIALKPDFSKAHSRLAHAQLSMGLVEDAIASAETSLEFDPVNGVAVATLDKARSMVASRASAITAPISAPRGGGGAPAGMPPNLAAMMGGMGGGAGAGGMDLSSMMNNPMMQEAMKDPAMMAMAQNMMKDPNAMSEMMKMMGGGGGMPPPRRR